MLHVAFYQSGAGAEPVRDWLKSQSITREERKLIGEEIKTVQFGWPIGMPVVRKMEPDLWEIRIQLPSGIARVLFTVKAQNLVLLHGFIKKSQKTPLSDLKLAKQRRANLAP